MDLKVAVDVQHLWKPPPQDHDRGTLFHLPDGTTMWETDCSLIYGQALAMWLRSRGADVLQNVGLSGVAGTPTQPMSYPARNRAASGWGAQVYVACHVNAGGGKYPLTEFMSTTRGVNLGTLVSKKLSDAFPMLEGPQVRGLHSGERGAVCIESCGSNVAAIIAEPFFGDQPAHQPLMNVIELQRIGAVIGDAIATWWQTTTLA